MSQIDTNLSKILKYVAMKYAFLRTQMQYFAAKNIRVTAHKSKNLKKRFLTYFIQNLWNYGNFSWVRMMKTFEYGRTRLQFLIF